MLVTPPKSRWRERLLALIASIVLVAILVTLWLRPQKSLWSWGGLYFPVRTKLETRAFAQGDLRWAYDHLGKSEGTMQTEGCAVTSAAIILATYGIDVDPGRLNRFLTDHEGYIDQGILVWERAADYAPGKCYKAYEGDASYSRIDLNLLRGNPVIVRVRLPSGITHFVVIVGKDGFDYLIRDPGSASARGAYPLSELVPRIEALRYYKKVGDRDDKLWLRGPSLM